MVATGWAGEFTVQERSLIAIASPGSSGTCKKC